MPIPVEQLAVWAEANPTDATEQALDSIDTVLQMNTYNKIYEYELFLYGSHANNTNTRSDEDIDIIAKLDSVFVSNISKTQMLAKDLKIAPYLYQHFEVDVKVGLRNHYGESAVEKTGKGLTVVIDNLPMPVNILPCIQYRHFTDKDN